MALFRRFLGVWILAWAPFITSVHADVIRVISSNALREVLIDAVPNFEKSSGHQVTMSFVGSLDILKKVRGGDNSNDLIVLQISSIDELTAEGFVVSGSRTDIARSLVGMAVRAGAPHPDISTGASLKRALLNSKSIVVSSGPSGDYMLKLLQRMEIPADHYMQAAPGVQTGVLVAKGEAEIGFQQVSELLPVKGIDFLGSLPTEVGHITVFAAGLHKNAASSQAATAFMQYLASPAVVPVLKAKGMEPVK